MVASELIQRLTEIIPKRGDLELNVTLLDWAIPGGALTESEVQSLVDDGSIDPLDDTFINVLVDDDFDVVYVG